MSLDHVISILSAAIAFAGLIFVAIQLRMSRQQREAEALVKIYDVNRELLSLGFDHPELFAILQDDAAADPVWQRRYLQLWLNHLSLLHFYLSRSAFAAELKDSESHALTDFMTLKNMRGYWQEKSEFYPVSFQKRVNAIIEKSGLQEAARRDLASEHLPRDPLESDARHTHETFARRSGKDASGVCAGNVSLDEHVIVSDDGRRAGTVVAQPGKLSIFPNDLLNRHFSGIFGFFRSVKQNSAFCFRHEFGSAFV